MMNPGMYSGKLLHRDTETRHGLPVFYVPVPTLPLITNWIDPILWARASRKAVTDVIGSSWNDLIIDAHFLYPDAVAAVILGRQLGVPVVMTARGSDVNVKCENPVMRRWVYWAAKRCSAIITVSQALANKLGKFGIPAAKINVLPNGVDLEKFRPKKSQQFRSDMVVEGIGLLSVGHLVKDKGHHVAIEALANLPEATLFIIGEGPEEQSLRNLAQKLGVASRVCFLGYVHHDQMADKYSAADFTILASANEGMPNVMLESLACGTRVIATDVGGVGEVITAQVAGAIMESRGASSVTESIRMLAEARHKRSETRDFATQFDWNGTVERQLLLYEQLFSR